MFRLFFVLISFVGGQTTIGNCDLNQPPTSWLVTSAIGIKDWATAGVKPTGPNFCLQGDKTAETVKIAYHINLPSIAKNAKIEAHVKPDDNPNNVCINKDPRIQYCFALCLTEDLEEKAIQAALSSGTTWIVADFLEKEMNDPNWAITVLAVDYQNPETHLNVSSFLVSEWCSVYVGINPKIGFPYLFEIQLGYVISNNN